MRLLNFDHRLLVKALGVSEIGEAQVFCPNCSQQQSSDEMRFCSRCGFPLAGVMILLDKGGVLPLLEKDPGQKLRISRRKMISESAILTLIAWAAALVATLAFDYGGPLETFAKISTVIFFLVGLIGLIRFTYAFLFVSDTTRPSVPSLQPQPSFQRAALAQSSSPALSPQPGIPVSDYPRRSNTREMVPQPSVTENTTRLLADEPDKRNE